MGQGQHHASAGGHLPEGEYDHIGRAQDLADFLFWYVFQAQSDAGSASLSERA